MADPYLGAIHIFAGDYAPVHYAICDGHLLPIQQNTALFALLGKTFGGDGKTTFALPDLRGRIPVHMGNASGNITNWAVGLSLGYENVQLDQSQIPAHTHFMQAASTNGSGSEPGGCVSGASSTANVYSPALSSPVKMADQSIQTTGANQGHENRMPFLSVNFIIALQGVYPMKP